MNTKNHKKLERKPSHAGQILKSGFIDEYDLRISTIAKLLGIARQHLSRILNGRNPITPGIAIRLEALTKTPASQWLAIQAEYDTYVLEQKDDFKLYTNAISKWTANSLPMQPAKRRRDEKTKKLVEKAAEFAKQLSKNKLAPN